MNPLRIILILAVLGCIAPAQRATGAAAPIFSSNDVLDITITAPFTEIMGERFYDVDSAGTISYIDDKAGEVTLDVGIRTRGRYRRQARICRFAPLRLNFRKSTTDNTLFAKSNKLKMVTHCRNGSKEYVQAVLREYLAYRIFNIMTDVSFRVRLLRVTYVDTNKGKEQQTYAFLIEHRNQLGKRIDLRTSAAEQTEIEFLDGAYTNLVSVFQYMIGNTDFSPIRAAEGEPCCHNNVLFGDIEGEMLAIPYDFDMTGLADTPHTSTNPRFNLRNAKERLFRGRCDNNQHLESSVQAFLDRKAAIENLLAETEPMNKGSKRHVSRFFKKFWQTVESPSRWRAFLAERCLK